MWYDDMIWMIWFIWFYDQIIYNINIIKRCKVLLMIILEFQYKNWKDLK